MIVAGPSGGHFLHARLVLLPSDSIPRRNVGGALSQVPRGRTLPPDGRGGGSSPRGSEPCSPGASPRPRSSSEGASSELPPGDLPEPRRGLFPSFFGLFGARFYQILRILVDFRAFSSMRFRHRLGKFVKKIPNFFHGFLGDSRGDLRAPRGSWGVANRSMLVMLVYRSSLG